MRLLCLKGVEGFIHLHIMCGLRDAKEVRRHKDVPKKDFATTGDSNEGAGLLLRSLPAKGDGKVTKNQKFKKKIKIGGICTVL